MSGYTPMEELDRLIKAGCEISQSLFLERIRRNPPVVKTFKKPLPPAERRARYLVETERIDAD